MADEAIPDPAQPDTGNDGSDPNAPMDGSGNADPRRSTILERLSDGESLSAICRTDGMPAWSTIHRWMDDDEDFAGQITRARECGYMIRAERAVEDAKRAEDAAKGRLALDAERWFLGKLSNAFSDKQKHELTGKDGAPIQTTQRIERVIIDPANPDGA